MISILLLSWDRYETLQKTLPLNLSRCKQPYELLVCDQGSTDPRVLNFLKSFNPIYLRQNSHNEGCGKSFNQLYLRSSGDIIALMSNDIEWPDNWGGYAVDWLNKVQKPGLCGILWGHSGTPPLSNKQGITAYWLTEQANRIFGPTMFKRALVDEIGMFYERFYSYGLEDSELNERVNRSGHNSFYIPGLMSNHLINDVGENSEYRQAKDRSMEKNLQIFWERHDYFQSGGSLKVDLPEMKDPL